MVVATSAFLVSLIGIATLFSVKYQESKTGRIYFPALRDASDEKAVALKVRILGWRIVIEQLPPILMILMRNLVRVAALRFASLLKQGESQAHRLADMVSYKHRFERRETRSEFLKKVSDHKNGVEQNTAEIVHVDQKEVVG
jgi:hypothetical protein